jgi:hypothetical protein
MMFAAKFAIVLAAFSLVPGVSAEKNCTQSNGYKYSVCGSGLKDALQKCCKYAEKCVQVKPFSGDDLTVCSEARQLTNTKAVKIVIYPLFFMLLEAAFIAFLVLKCGIKNPAVMLCVVALATAWPFLFSKYWAFGVYTMFLAVLVAAAAGDCCYRPKMPFYAYRLVWALTIFQIVALFGPFEAFNAPLYNWSKGTNMEVIKNVYDQSGCNTFYDSYFTILSIEKQEKEADPDATYGGYCSKGWLATVQGFGVIQSIVWIGIVLVSGKYLLAIDVENAQPISKAVQQ